MDWTVILIVAAAGAGLTVLTLRRAGLLRSRGGGCCGSADGPPGKRPGQRR
jgi:hypothetical protein